MLIILETLLEAQVSFWAVLAHSFFLSVLISIFCKDMYNYTICCLNILNFRAILACYCASYMLVDTSSLQDRSITWETSEDMFDRCLLTGT